MLLANQQAGLAHLLPSHPGWSSPGLHSGIRSCRQQALLFLGQQNSTAKTVLWVVSCSKTSKRCAQAWKRICEASARAFDSVYERMGVRLTLRGESFYNPLLQPLVAECMAAGFAEESEGAKVSCLHS